LKTGLAASFLKEARLRVSASRFRKELMRDDDRTLGRYDARFMGWDPDAAGETPGSDPSDTGIAGTYVGAFHDYIQRELKYMSQETYYTSGPGVNSGAAGWVGPMMKLPSALGEGTVPSGSSVA